MAKVRITRRGKVKLTMSRDEAAGVYNAMVTLDADRVDSSAQCQSFAALIGSLGKSFSDGSGAAA